MSPAVPLPGQAGVGHSTPCGSSGCVTTPTLPGTRRWGPPQRRFTALLAPTPRFPRASPPHLLIQVLDDVRWFGGGMLAEPVLPLSQLVQDLVLLWGDQACALGILADREAEEVEPVVGTHDMGFLFVQFKAADREPGLDFGQDHFQTVPV